MNEYLDDAPCGFLIFDDHGIIRDVNSTLTAWVGYEKDELVGKKVDVLLNIAGRIFYQTHFFPLIKLHNKAEEVFLTLLGKGGKEIPMLVNAKRKEINQLIHNICVFVPVYQRKEFEQQLLEAKKAAENTLRKNEHLQQLTAELEMHKTELDHKIGMLTSANHNLVQFGRVISHDVQEQVRKAAIFSDIMKNTAQKFSPEVEMSLSQIDLSIQKLQLLIVSLQQFMSASVIGSRDVEECDLNMLADSALRQVQAEHIGSIVATIGPLPEVQGNAAQLRLLFYHLFKNAAEHNTSHSTKIDVDGDVIQQNQFKHVKDKYRYVDVARIRVCDNGPGFGLEYKNYIFELFKKINPGTNGLGVGLALCKKIVENHFGYITAEAEVNKGSCFIAYLPVNFPGEVWV